MKPRLLLLSVLTLALAAPIAVSAETPSAAPSQQAQIAKKKLSYCQKKGKKEKGKFVGKVKKAKFFLYTTKRPTSYFFCSESPKFSGEIAAWEGIKKTSHLRAVKNNCAVFYSEEKPGTGMFTGEKELKIVPAKFFRKGAAQRGQTQASVLGKKDETVSLESLELTSNCVIVGGYFLNGAPMLTVAGSGDFPYQGHVRRAIPGATAAELKAIKVNVVSPTAVQVTWTQGGVAKTLDYPGTFN